MRRAALILIVALAGCARTAGTEQARARAGSDARVRAGQPASFSATCEGCQGAPHFSWSLAVGPSDHSCALSGADSASPQLTCAAEGTWVLRVDVRDSRGAGLPDYANAIVGAPPPDAGLLDGGPLDAGPGDAGALDAGPSDAGPTDAGPLDAGPFDAGPLDAGGLTGTLTVTFPDGTPATRVLPGDLLELHATPSNAFAGCAFDAPPANAQYLASQNLCDTAIVLLAPATNVSFGVTFSLAGSTAHATSAPVSAAAAVRLNNSALAVDTVAVAPATGQVIASRPGHSALLAEPGAAPVNWTVHSSGVSCAGGPVRDMAWPAGNLGRVLPDGGTDSTTTSAADFISCATAAGRDASGYLPVLAATDGSIFAAWGESGGGTEDSTYSVDAVVNIEDPATSGDTSAGVLTIANGDTLDFIDWTALHDFAISQTPFTPQPVPTSLTGLTRGASSPASAGTLWLADQQGGLVQFQGTLFTSAFGLGLPTLQLSGSAPVDALAVEHGAPYAEDLWVAANGGLERVNAASNTVGALPQVLHVDPGLTSGATVNGIAVGRVSGARALYIAASNGLYILKP